MNKSNTQLSAAIRKGNTNVNASVVPEDEGHLSILVMNSSGHVTVHAVHPPHLILTLIDKKCLIGHTAAEQNE